MTTECIALLSDLPKELKDEDAQFVRGSISKANSIVLNILDSSVMSRIYDISSNWSGPLSLFREVVRYRIYKASRLELALQLSKDKQSSMSLKGRDSKDVSQGGED